MIASSRTKSFLLVALSLVVFASTALALDVVYPHNLCGKPGETKTLDMWARVSNPDGMTEWCIANTGGDDFDVGFGQSSDAASPYVNGYFRIQVSFTIPVTACSGEKANYTIDVKVDGAVVATAIGTITAWGEKGGQHYAAVEPTESHAETPVAGDVRRVSFLVQNEESDGLPHTYDFLAFSENQLAPGLDLYELTPVSGFDLPTVIGAGTPLMSGKLEEILPFDSLLVEVDVHTHAGRDDGEGNLLWLEVVDDSSPAALSSSSVVVISCSLDPVAATSTRNGSGTNPSCVSSAAPPVIGSDWSGLIDTSVQPGANFSALVGYDQPSAPLPTHWGELLVAPEPLGGVLLLSSVLPSSGGVDAHVVAVPNDACLGDFAIYTQGVLIGGGVSLCNALDLTLGFQ